MSDQKPKKIERQIAIGAAGLMMGLLVGSVVFRDANAPPPTPVTAEAAPVSPTPAAVAAARVEAATAPGAAAAAEAPAAPEVQLPQKGVSDALRAAIAKDEWFLPVRQRLHEALGTGALFRNGEPTAPGRWIVERVEATEDHAVDGGGYVGLGLTSALRAAAEGTERAEAKAEARLGKALIRLILDYRFIKRTGPFKRNLVRESTLAKRTKKHNAIVLRALEFVSAESASEAAQVLDPPHPDYLPLVAALKRYREYRDKGDCPRLDTSLRLRPGDTNRHIKPLQKRLACEGLYDGPIDGVYDDDVLEGVKIYQRTHELGDDGLVFAGTLRSMNVPMKRRVEQIELTLQRLRESRVWEMSDFYLKVNLPAFQLEAVADGEIIRRHKVIVGTNRLDDDKQKLVQGHLNRTRLFESSLYRVEINPAWILPERIAKGELQGKMAEDPEYLARQNIKEKVLSDGRKVLIQGFGETNVLGKVKFLLRESNAIYLHDTDKKELFRKNRRDFSHGCVRVHEAVEFAKWLLHRDGYGEREIRQALKLKKRQRGMDLSKPVDFMTEYHTVDTDEAGRPVFLTDIYGYDKAVEQDTLPPRTKVLWGSSTLRPNWVPLVPESVVKGWRKAGKPAPRNYDPQVHGG